MCFVSVLFYLSEDSHPCRKKGGSMTHTNRLIITNNPLVSSALSSSPLSFHKVLWIDGKTEDVLTAVRNHCHLHHRLLTHPLTGSIKPNQTPFKTVVMEMTNGTIIDYQSVLMAETSLNKTYDMLKSKPRPLFNESILHDFAMIDMAFFKSYLETIN